MLDSLVRVSRRVGWTTDHSPLTRGVESPASARLQHQVAEHRQAVHSIQNTAGAKVVSQHEALADASSLLSSADRRAIYHEPITPLEHPRVTRGDTLPRSLLTVSQPVVALPDRKGASSERPPTYVSTKPLGFEGRASQNDTESCQRLCDSTRLPVNGFTYY